MNDSIIVAAIGAGGAICAAVINSWLKRPAENTSPVIAPKIEEPPKPITRTQLETIQTKPESLFVSAPLITLSHQEISNAIENVPPFQQDGVHDAFVGKRVCWEGRFSSFSRLSDKVSISIDLIADKSYAICYANPEDCGGLEFARKDSLVRVAGEIERLNPYESTLINCHIVAIPTDAA